MTFRGYTFYWLVVLFFIGTRAAAGAGPGRDILDTSDGDVKQVLTDYARGAGLSVVMPANISGKVTAVLQDQTWQNVFTAVLLPLGYEWQEVGSIIQVRQREVFERYVPVGYVDSKLVADALSQVISKMGSVHDVGRAVVIRDVAERIDHDVDVIRQLDTPPVRVMVKCRFFETDLSKSHGSGINWSGLSGVTVSLGNAQQSLPGTPFSGVLSVSGLAAVVSALDSDTKTKTLAEPNVLVVDGKTAVVLLGQQYPIPQYSFSAQQAVVQVSGIDYKDIGISLTVTPRVCLSGIVLQIKPEVSSISGTVTFAGVGGTAIPTITDRSVDTVATLRDGETVILGGLVYETSEADESSVPVASRIPLLGALFKGRSSTKNRQELTVMVTVSIVPLDAGPVPVSVIKNRIQGK